MRKKHKHPGLPVPARRTGVAHARRSETQTTGIQHTQQKNAEQMSVVDKTTSEGNAVGQDTTSTPELTTDHTGARDAPEVTATGIQQHTQQLNVISVVETSTSKEDSLLVEVSTTDITFSCCVCCCMPVAVTSGASRAPV